MNVIILLKFCAEIESPLWSSASKVWFYPHRMSETSSILLLERSEDDRKRKYNLVVDYTILSKNAIKTSQSFRKNTNF